jgi:hypothetical protein
MDHRGVSIEHLIASGSGLALLYNDRVVLENHHTFNMFDLLLKPHFNILAKLEQDQYVECRKTMISCIMATDMKAHAGLCSRLQAHAFKFFETDVSGLFPITQTSTVTGSRCWKHWCTQLWSSFVTLFPGAFVLANLLINLKAYEEVSKI